MVTTTAAFTLPPDYNERVHAAYIALHQQLAKSDVSAAESGTAPSGAGSPSKSAASASSGLFAGKFLVVTLADGHAPIWPMAGTIAGAAVLSIAATPAQGKLMLRLGLCDFVVTSLDESLRILKNEIRKKQPVSVVVTGPIAAVTAEMQERGVSPDLTLHEPAPASPQPPDAGDFASAYAKPLPVVAADSPLAIRITQRWNAASPRFLPRHTR